MTADQRRDKVLHFLHEQDIALPPTAIYGGLRRKEGITFGYRTVQSALNDLREVGFVTRVDPVKLRDDGTITPIEGGKNKRAYYFITEKGRDQVKE